MPLPFIVGAVLAKVVLGAGVAAGVTGAAKGVKGVMDSSEAKDIQRRAEILLEESKKSLEGVKELTTQTIIKLGETKLKALGNEIDDFVSVFSKIRNIDLKDSIGIEELKMLGIGEETLTDMRTTSLEAKDLLSGGVAGVGSGTLLGLGAFKGVMALGTASTGTAIGGLSGAAATNATLAWLGGGALSAGGGGMALGTVVLGGIVAGPALLLAGGIFSAKAKEKLNNAYSNLSEARRISEELKTAEKQLDVISHKAYQVDDLLRKLVYQFGYTIKRLDEVVREKNDWKQFTHKEKEIAMISFKYAQVIKGIIDTPLLTQDGMLTTDIDGVLTNNDIRQLSNTNI